MALATLGLGESVRIFIAVTPALGSSTGLMMIPAPSIGSFVFDSFTSYYYLVMTAALVGSISLFRSCARLQDEHFRQYGRIPLLLQ